MPDCGVGLEKSAKIIRDLAGCNDVRIQAAVAFAGMQDIPQGDAGRLQRLLSQWIGRIRRKPEQLGHDAPECVLPVGVILVGSERGEARHAAEDQDLGSGILYRRKTVNPGHARFFSSRC